MLPEFLFNVGNSMQDISRDEINLLNGASTACEKDMCSSVIRSTAVSPLPLKTTVIQMIPDVSLIHPIKLEDDTTDLYNSPWNHITNPTLEMGSSKLLLQGSDDPLISRGAHTVDDDHASEFNSIITPLMAKNMSTSKSQLKAKLQCATKKVYTPKVKRKGAIKLRFHHQALPAEYLSHYEATQGQHIRKVTQPALSRLGPDKSAPKNSHENVRNWLQKIAEMHQQSTTKNVKEESIVEEVPNLEHPQAETDVNENIQKSQRRVVNYADLPYMGEMTLDNSKPRRGRKPKKADICHLIYKNYGTIVPGTPKTAIDEKLLTESSSIVKEDEPLNLCLRDHADSYSISSNEDEGSETKTNSNCPTPNSTPLDTVTDSILATNLKLSLPTVESKILPQDKTLDNQTLLSPPANVLLHPMSLYYQKLIETGNFTTSNLQTISYNNQLSLKIPIRNTNLAPHSTKTERTSSTPEYPEQLPTPSSVKSETSTTTSASQFPNLPQKRKRSAIFIPPMPAENNTNPATEVSICKFKFTGGANPSLQEKKMLSVDSDGNYRYYSGTGDKSMRSYEFFPRESLQQSGAVPGMNCAGVFLNATGEKITIDVPPPSTGLSNELLQIPDSPTNILLPSVSVGVSTNSSPLRFSSTAHLKNTDNINPVPNNHHHTEHVSSKKKKSRRAVQREKLEKTFKEKGFLIQTQQLESAEGATYCKFRQLKKFTRYLFRNWKDYLPAGELHHPNAAAVAAAAAAAALNNRHQHSTPPPPPASSVIGSILAESYTNHQRSRDTNGFQDVQNT